jgi:hypothetical protein
MTNHNTDNCHCSECENNIQKFFRKLSEAIDFAMKDMADGEAQDTEVLVEWHQYGLTLTYLAVVNYGDSREYSRWETLNW